LSPDFVPCTVEATDFGWWLRFPADPHAGLLLETDAEKRVFAHNCQVDLDDEDLLLALDLGEITQCPDSYYQRAKTFRDPYWQ
jgi:hypothetical protein